MWCENNFLFQSVQFGILNELWHKRLTVFKIYFLGELILQEPYWKSDIMKNFIKKYLRPATSNHSQVKETTA